MHVQRKNAGQQKIKMGKYDEMKKYHIVGWFHEQKAWCEEQYHERGMIWAWKVQIEWDEWSPRDLHELNGMDCPEIHAFSRNSPASLALTKVCWWNKMLYV